MGTSASSAGASSGVSFDPPWLDAAGAGIDDSNSNAELAPSSGDPTADGDSEADAAQPSAGGVAPPARYREARTQLTKFINSGDGTALRGALSSFVNKGLGGAGRAAHRMRTTSVAASALGGFLAAARDGTDANINAWVDSAKARGLSAADAALEIVNQLVPNGGSVDEESAKHSMDQAIAHLYEVNPNVDLFAMTDDQIGNVMAFTVAYDVYNRAQLELGRAFERLEYSAHTIHERLGQLRDYIVVVVQEAMTKAREVGFARSVRQIATAALRDALNIFGAA